MDQIMVEEIAAFYESKIYQIITNTFNHEFEYEYGGRIVARDAMGLADWMGNQDGKICILLLDIRDDYEKDVNDSYIAGYFWAGDLFTRSLSNPYSNKTDMVYIDINPGSAGSTGFYSTIAHEMQHLFNFATSVGIRADRNEAGNITRYNEMDIWVNEGLSAAAEWMLTDRHPEGRWRWYNEDRSKQIRNGNNFFVWGNRRTENSQAILDDYATVYLFFQWLRLHFGGTEIFRQIFLSNYGDYRAVTSATDALGYSDWGNLLCAWLAANYINASSGIYGYKDESDLSKVKAPMAPALVGDKLMSLYPGEGVYSLSIAGMNAPSASGHINYAGLTRVENSGDVSSSVPPGGALLTYNANPNRSGKEESGIVTGEASAAAPGSGAKPARSASEQLKGPFPVGMGESSR